MKNRIKISGVLYAIGAAFIVAGLSVATDRDWKAQEAAERHAARMAADFARKDGGRAEMELRELVIAARRSEKQQLHEARARK